MTVSKSPLHVAAAVIFGSGGQILIARRPEDKHQGGLWEFPGGKVELGETAFSALARELLEELGITDIQASPLIQITHDYPERSVLLDVYSVTDFVGNPKGCEGQPIQWVSPSALINYPFPEANQPIIDHLLAGAFD